jgi:Helix-turn-helix domain
LFLWLLYGRKSMSNTRAARSNKDQPPPIDPALQSKLVAKFGAKLMKRGFTAIPDLVLDYFRYVPGKELPHEVIDIETGEVSVVYAISHMTPTEYTLMVAIWSYWWTDQNNPWPSVAQLCKKIGKCERQVRRYLQRLRDKGFMLSLEQYNYEGKQISNRYDFSPFIKRLLGYLDALEQPVQPRQEDTRDDISDGERVTELPGSGCQNDQANQIENETETSKEENSDSSGEAASTKGTGLPLSPTYSHLPHGAIRSTEEGTNTTPNIESDRTSNRTPASKELGAARRAKNVNMDRKDETGAKFETSKELAAAAAGIPREHLESLEQGARKRPDVPFFIEACLGQISDQLNDAGPNSSISQAYNLHAFYAEQFEDFDEEQFRMHLYAALRLANRLTDAETKIRHNGKANKMPAFFRAFRANLRRAYGVEPLEGGAKKPEPPSVPEIVAPSAPVSPSEDEVPLSDERQEAQPEEPTHFVRIRKPVRTNEQRVVREQYAKQVREQLRTLGAHNSWEMMIDREHVCGCPLYDNNWRCVHCHPDLCWNPEVRDLIDTILES